MASYFEINNLNIGFKTPDGDKNVIDIEKLSIEKGEVFGIVGESGAGKTVLAKTILRLLPSPPCIIAPEGTLVFDGNNILQCTEREMREKIRGRRIAMIFQDPMSTLNPVFTVGQQINDVITACRGIKRPQKMAIEMLERVRMPDAVQVMRKYPHELSGGQRQRVIIATALSCGAEFLIADEPTRNLDVTIQAGILRIIEELRQELGITVLYLANNMGLVSVTCDNAAVLQKGRIVEYGSARQIISSPQSDYTKMLLDFNMEKTSAASNFETDGKSEEILKVTDLSKYFESKAGFWKRRYIRAVDGVDFSMNSGDTLGIVGESGCGKTTLINVLLNLEKPTVGTVTFEGQDINTLSKNQMRALRRHIQVVFQDPFWSLNPRMLIRDIIGEPLKTHTKLTAEAYAKKVNELLNVVGLPESSAYRFPHEFSGGQRQRIAIARALALEAKFIVLDEPTSSIDIVSQSQILDLLAELKRIYNLTYVIISHDLGVISQMATHIAVMYLGKIVEYGVASQIFSDPIHPYTKALMGALPRLDMNSLDELSVLEGQVPSAIDIPSGCRFHTRCTQATSICAEKEPLLCPQADNRLVACNVE